MTCKTPCSNCTCSPCGFLDYADDFPFETERCGLAALQETWLNSPSTVLTRFCAIYPSAPECKVYED